jgi:hypothetical protein
MFDNSEAQNLRSLVTQNKKDKQGRTYRSSYIIRFIWPYH